MGLISNICNHTYAFYFHENAPLYCPECGSYIDGGMIISKGEKYMLKERKVKMDKIIRKLNNI